MTVLLTACGTTRFYPICILDSLDVPIDRLWVRSKPYIVDVVTKTVVGGYERMSIDPTGITITAYRIEHKNLGAVWPSIACISSLQFSASDILFRQCQEDMRRYFTESWDSWPGNQNQASSICSRYDPNW